MGSTRPPRLGHLLGRPATFEDLGQLSWIVVETEVEDVRWEMLTEEEHFLGAGLLVGRRLRTSFTAAAMATSPRCRSVLPPGG